VTRRTRFLMPGSRTAFTRFTAIAFTVACMIGLGGSANATEPRPIEWPDKLIDTQVKISTQLLRLETSRDAVEFGQATPADICDPAASKAVYDAVDPAHRRCTEIPDEFSGRGQTAQRAKRLGLSREATSLDVVGIRETAPRPAGGSVLAAKCGRGKQVGARART
jgi:hypothetical protein